MSSYKKFKKLQLQKLVLQGIIKQDLVLKERKGIIKIYEAMKNTRKDNFQGRY